MGRSRGSVSGAEAPDMRARRARLAMFSPVLSTCLPQRWYFSSTESRAEMAEASHRCKPEKSMMVYCRSSA